MLPLVELINTTMCSSDSTDSSFLDLLNASPHAYDFKISLKGFKPPIVVDLVAATLIPLVLHYKSLDLVEAC